MISLHVKMIRTVFLGVVASLIGACGGSNQVPADSEVVINPEESTLIRTLEGGCDSSDLLIEDELVTISVLNAEGVAITNADIIVSLGGASNTSNSPTLELYDDLDGDFVPDPDELVSGADDPLLQTKTSSSSGEKYVIVRAYYGCSSYTRIMMVAASAASGSASFSYELEIEEVAP